MYTANIAPCGPRDLGPMARLLARQAAAFASTQAAPPLSPAAQTMLADLDPLHYKGVGLATLRQHHPQTLDRIARVRHKAPALRELMDHLLFGTIAPGGCAALDGGAEFSLEALLELADLQTQLKSLAFESRPWTSVTRHPNWPSMGRA